MCLLSIKVGKKIEGEVEMRNYEDGVEEWGTEKWLIHSDEGMQITNCYEW